MDKQDIDLVNRQLIDHFGRLEGDATWRVVWSEDQFEWRYGTFQDRTVEGLLIREVTETRRVPKYRQWIHNKWILERLLVVPNTGEVHPQLTTKLSYEVLYVFEEDLPPVWIAVKFIIENVYANMKQHNTSSPRPAKYADPESDPGEAREVTKERIKDLEESLFGNETETGDALAYKQGVGFTTSKLLSSKEREN